MTVPYVYTFADAIDSLVDFGQGVGIGAHQAVLRRCIQAAYREMVARFDWAFLNVSGRVPLQKTESTGTVVYTHSTRTLTLTGATWPSWIEDGSIRFNSVVSDVDRQSSPTVVTLDQTLNPGADVASTTYVAFPRWYILPNDFISIGKPLEESTWLTAESMSQADILGLQRNDASTGDIRFYAIGPAPDLYGSMALYVWPPSDTTETLDFPYKRRARRLRYSGHDSRDYAGTIAISAGGSTIAGTSTTFQDGHAGSIIRLHTLTSRPTGEEGGAPYEEQRAVQSVTDADTLILDAAVTSAYSGRGYVISDPIDLGVTAWDAFLRCCEKHFAHNRRMKDRKQIRNEADAALSLAKQGDSRIRQRRIAGARVRYQSRLADSTSRPYEDFS